MSHPARAALVSLSLLLSGGSGLAQTYTEAELKAIFLRQMESVRTVEANPELGKSRGLTLNAVEAPPAAVGDAASASAPKGSAASSGPASGPADGAALTPKVYLSLPSRDQVNVRVVFDFDSAVIADDQKPTLRRFCGVMDEVGIKHFRIIGHTDAAGTDGYNRRLSVERAEAVRDYFVGECRIAPNRLEAIGVGEQFLADPAAPRSGENRRVEFQALG